MAIAKEIWEQIEADYEVGIFKEETIFSDLAKKYKVDRGGISKKAKAKGWEYGKNSHLSHQESTNIKGFLEINEEKSHLNHTEITAVDSKTKQLLEKEGINSNTIHMAKIMQSRLLDSMENMLLEGLKPKEITSAMKDLHDMNNPKEAANINVTAANQTNIDKNLKVSFE